MDFRKITDDITVSPQIAIGDVKAIADAGYRALVCNRPDGEGADQTPFEVLAKEAEALGLKAVYMPVVSGHVTEADGARFEDVLRDLPAPVFAYCRSGTRCATLWSISAASQLPASDILEATRAAGYDMSGVLARFPGNKPGA